MNKLSAVIITFNEEKYLEKCLVSLQGIADEVVIVDSFSTDNTQSIAKKYKARIIEQKFLGYVEQKNFAIQQAQYEYILSLDGDEALSAELKKSILKAKEKFEHDVYSFNRLNNYCGQWIKHSNWYPDRKNRLFKKGKAVWKGTNPHDHLAPVDHTKPFQLQGDLLHWTYDTYEEHYLKIYHFSSISAKAMHKKGKKATWLDLLIRPFWKFFKNYFIKAGFKDGLDGLWICYSAALSTFLKYFKLYKIQKAYEDRI